MQTDPEIANLVKELSRLLPAAKVYPFTPLFSGAREHQCHDNADQFVAVNEGYRVVRGWLYFDFREHAVLLFGSEPFIRFSAHSLVQDVRGERYEITPSKASQPYPFIEHPFGKDDFDKLVDGRQLSNIDVEV